MYFTTALMSAKITAVRARIVADTGAYASLGVRFCSGLARTQRSYQIDNVDIEDALSIPITFLRCVPRLWSYTDLLRRGEQPESAAAKLGISHGRFVRNAIEPAACFPTDRLLTQERH